MPPDVPPTPPSPASPGRPGAEPAETAGLQPSVGSSAQTEAAGGPPPHDVRPPLIVPVPRRRTGWLVGILGEEEAAEFRSIPARIRAWLDAWVRKSPPFTVSLSVHVALLLALALVFVRLERTRRRPIDLSFAAANSVEAERAGVQMVEPEPEPEPVSQPDAVDEPEPVEDPVAAPIAAAAEQVNALGSEPEPAAAPAVGSLLDGRVAGRRERLVAAYGGTAATEAAVTRALDWLARQQQKNGLWSLRGPYASGGSQENQLAATAMALLAFHGAGTTPREGPHHKAVAAAWTALLKRQVAGPEAAEDRADHGRFVISAEDPPAHHALYAHAQATIAICELYGMTKDPIYEQPARRAVAYAVAAQGRNGGWRYEPGQDGDMSVTGWYLMALKSAQMAGLDVPAATWDGVERFLDHVAVDGGRRYGYRFDDRNRTADLNAARRVAGPVTAAVSAEGLLCRQYLGWPRTRPELTAGVEALVGEKFLDWEHDKDVYAWYYITQVVHHVGGPAWQRWNGRLVEVLPAAQVAKGSERGSWDPALDKWGANGGRLFVTCFCTYMLEVYYRHLPLYGEAAGQP